MASESHPPAKLCPRCGAFYQDLKSQTCPQCFARLDVLDDESALRLTEEQAARIRSGRNDEARAKEDERFNEQSFGACLAVMGVLIVTLIVAIVFIRIAATRNHEHPTLPSSSPAASSAPASPDTLLPAHLAGLSRDQLRTAALLPGTTTPLYEAVYQQKMQVYALPSEGITTEQKDALHLAATLAAGQHTPPWNEQEITTSRAQYAILGSSNALVAQVAQSLVGSKPK